MKKMKKKKCLECGKEFDPEKEGGRFKNSHGTTWLCDEHFKKWFNLFDKNGMICH